MSLNIPLDVLGMFYIVWIPMFWAAYVPLSRRLRTSWGVHLPLALMVQIIPPFGVIFLLILLYFVLKKDHEGATRDSSSKH